MPGFMQFITGVYLFLGLTLFGTFTAAPLYMAALAFTAYGVPGSRWAGSECAERTRG